MLWVNVSIAGVIKLVGSDSVTSRNNILLARVCGILNTG